MEFPPEGNVGNDVSPPVSQLGGTESESSTNWKAILFILLWVGGVLLYMIFFWILSQTSKQRAKNEVNPHVSQQVHNETSPAPQGDMEAQESAQNDANQDDVFPIHPSLVWIPTIASAIAFSLSVVPHASCEMLDLDEDSRFQSLGLWANNAHDDNCYSNFRKPDLNSDTSLVVARITGILSSFLGGVCWIAFMGILFLVLRQSATSPRGLPFGKTTFWILSLSLLIVTIAQATTLSLLGTETCTSAQSCYFDFGGFASITATAFWFLSLLAVLLSWRSSLLRE